MEIQEIFDKYLDKMAQLHLYQRTINKIMDKEYQLLEEQAKFSQERPESQEFSYSYHSMFFPNAKDGQNLLLSKKKISICDRKLVVALHKNKQYQWLLAEAYEEFEIFIESVYAYAGSSNNSFWPPNDYGPITLQELESKDFNWFIERAKEKRNTPHSILNRFRTAYPELCNIEANNALKVDLKLAIVLIEHLRHIIVHKGGVATDKQKFIEQVLKKAGFFNNGNYREEHVDFIRKFFCAGKYKNMVVILEVPIQPEVPIINIHENVFDLLSGYLVSYSHFLCGLLKPN